METVEQRADRLVSLEIHVCLSSLISTLAKGYGAIVQAEGISDLCEQAFELACPIDDYEEAATEAGWQIKEGSFFHNGDGHSAAAEASPADACGWEELCREFDIEPYQIEVYEHWAVSDWFGRKLKDAGEKVDFDFAGMAVWARTTTGQMISMDGVIQKIAKSLLA